MNVPSVYFDDSSGLELLFLTKSKYHGLGKRFSGKPASAPRSAKPSADTEIQFHQVLCAALRPLCLQYLMMLLYEILPTSSDLQDLLTKVEHLLETQEDIINQIIQVPVLPGEALTDVCKFPWTGLFDEMTTELATVSVRALRPILRCYLTFAAVRRYKAETCL